MRTILHSKWITSAVVILFIGIGTTHITGQTAIENPDSVILNGNILYVGGSGLNNYTNIQDAVNDAENGDTVFVYNGNYTENVKVDRTINLIGEDKYNTVIDGPGTGVSISADGVSVSGFTLTNSIWGGHGVAIHSKNNLISDNIISSNNDGISFYLEGYDNNIILNNTIFNNSHNGISIWYCNNSQVIGNTIFENGWSGMYISHARDGKISGNIISSNIDHGIRLTFSFGNNISGNSLIKNALSGIGLTYSVENDIYQNNFISNKMRNAAFM